MNNFACVLLGAIGGAGLGSFVTYNVIKNRLEEEKQEEIDAIKATYSKKEQLIDDKKEEAKEEIKSAFDEFNKGMDEYARSCSNQKTDYNKIISSNSYSDENKEEASKMNTNVPYLISHDEYGEEESYDVVTLTLYSDGCLVNEMNEIESNVEMTIGVENLATLGEDGSDAIYVRNDILMIDYEILYDLKNFSDIKPGTLSID